MLIYYIRHGDPVYDPDQLTPLGEQQAAAVTNRLALFGVDEIYSSTSNRAIQTAKPLCEKLGLEVKTLDFLHEDHLRGLERPKEDGAMAWIWAHPVYSQLLCSREVRELGEKWYNHPDLEQFHFDRVILPVQEQLDDFLASLGYGHDLEKGLYKVTNRQAEKRIAIFAHECMGKVFMSHLLDIPFAQYAAHFEMHTSGVSVIRFDDGIMQAATNPPYPYARARLLTLSNDAHLYHEGVSLTHRFTRLREQY